MTTLLSNKILEVKNLVKEWKKKELRIGLVPTMGALHLGHESLIKRAKELCDKVVVSVFVNPIQFGPNEDYAKYPRDIEKDLEVCKKLGVDVVFAPTPNEMYGENNRLNNNDLTFVCPPYEVVDCMCGKSRVGHFDGVATVVLKLFNIVKPDIACFGQKDAQQLFIIKKMVKDLNLDIEIVACKIVRDSDGLALSSRNKYLSEEERVQALTISKGLKHIETLYKNGIKDSKVLFDAVVSILDKSIELEYIEFRDFETFKTVEEIKENTLMAIAVKLGSTRLIDNILIK